MDWNNLLIFAAYSGLGIVSLLVWWVIYDLVLTPGLPVREAIFGRRTNPAVALDLLGGFLAMGLLVFSVMSSPIHGDFLIDLELTGLTLLGTVVLLGLLRLGIGGFLRLWFRSKKDAQGDIITINNELFKQGNVATALFTTSIYLILSAGLVEEDLLNLDGYRLEAMANMLGVWLLGVLVIFLHSLFFLGFGTSNHILHECFHDNNPAAGYSLLGLLGGTLLINNQLLANFEVGQHMFNDLALWGFLLGAMAVVVAIRGVLQIVLLALYGINLRKELVIRDNPAWGILDGGLILVLFWMLLALVT